MSLLISLFRNATTASICLILRSYSAAIARIVFQEADLHTLAKVWSQSFLYCCLQPHITHHTLYLSIFPSLLRLVLKTSFLVKTFCPFGTFDFLIVFQVFFLAICLYSLIRAASYFLASGLAIASLRVLGLSNIVLAATNALRQVIISSIYCAYSVVPFFVLASARVLTLFLSGMSGHIF